MNSNITQNQPKPPVQCSKSGKRKRKSVRRKNHINRKKLSIFFEKQYSYSQRNQRKLTEFENENKSVKQIANGYFFKWKKTKEENKRLLFSASSSSQPVDVPKSMIINKDLLIVEMGSILGEGTFGRCMKGKYKGLNVC